jgi:hypothetical protein
MKRFVTQKSIASTIVFITIAAGCIWLFRAVPKAPRVEDTKADREYQRPDKAELKSRIKSVLQRTPVYNDQMR